MTRHIQSLAWSEHCASIQGYLGIFNDIGAYSFTLKGLPCPFLKIEKNALIFGKKDPDCAHLWDKFCIQNVVM